MIEDCKDVSSLSKILSENLKEDQIYDKDEKYQLIDLVDDLLIVWCKKESCAYAQILQNIPVSESSRKNKEEIDNKIQLLALSKPPLWDVKSIILNKSATGFLIVGREGVGVVELPQRWGSPPLFEGGLKTLTCRVDYVGEHFFAFTSHVKIVSADWHPGSVNHSFITILTSDNYLRIYSILNLEFPEQAIAVAKCSNIGKEVGKFGMQEGAVAFGIGPPICGDEEQAHKTTITESSDAASEMVEEIEKQKNKYQDLLWPVFILYSNGDVYYIITTLRRSFRRKVLYGPLSMQPSSFDNYGVDFCSLLVLPSSPVVLVIANTKGFLHHCVVMETNMIDESLDEYNQMEQSMQDLSLSGSKLNLESPTVYLHVYESVVLNISYAKPSSAASSLISLIPDPNTPARYWVSHNEGCYGVSLPLVERLLPESEDMEFPGGDLECRAEHLLCTRPVASTTSCNVLGLCASPTSTLFALLSSGNIQTISLPAMLVPPIPSFHLQTPEAEASPLRKVYASSFEDRIISILQRKSSQPLLLSGSLTGAALEDCVKLLSKVTNTLRENYILPQIKAREEIKKRHMILTGQKEHLKRELSAIQNEKKIVTEKAHELAEKYEEANDRHSQLMQRLEIIIGRLVRKMPYLSANERGMLKELQDMTDKSKTFQLQLNQIESKFQWQTSQIEKENREEALEIQRGSTLSDDQLSCLKSSLAGESDKLEAVVKKINTLKKVVGL